MLKTSFLISKKEEVIKEEIVIVKKELVIVIKELIKEELAKEEL